MFEIFEEMVKELPFELRIVSLKRGNVKSNVEVEYDGIRTKVELRNSCSPGEERGYCWTVIATAMSNIYILKGDPKLAKTWMDAMHDKHQNFPKDA